MATLRVELPLQLHERLRELVADGWYPSETDVVEEAVRRFLEARAPEMMSRFIKEDVEWGPKG
jgi:Arc/MetJ-type ribon-helix-helix transcriptional regulator